MNFEDVIELADNIDKRLYGKKSIDVLSQLLLGEVNELNEALKMADEHSTISHGFECEKEFGDVLFCLMSIAKQKGIDPKSALKLTITKLQERVKFGITG